MHMLSLYFYCKLRYWVILFIQGASMEPFLPAVRPRRFSSS